MPQIKGTVLLSSRALMFETHGRAGLDQALELLGEDERQVINNELLAINWYPMSLFIRWLQAWVAVACDGDETKLIKRSARGLASQLKGPYKVFAFLASPEAVVVRLASINQAYFQGVTTSVTKLGPGHLLVNYTGLEPSHRLFEYILLGWWEQILFTTRAKNPKVSLKRSLANWRDSTCSSDGDHLSGRTRT